MATMALPVEDRRRSVSPLGKSRFEKPFAAPSVHVRSRLNSPTTTTYTTSSSSATTHRANDSLDSSELSTQPTSHSTAATSIKPSTASIADSSITALPSFRQQKQQHHQSRRWSARTKPPHHPTPGPLTLSSTSPACAFPPDDSSPDAWFTRFRSDPDLSADLTDACPDRATLASVYDTPLYAADGSTRAFGSLFDPAYAPHPRQLLLFVRHFYCGACQAYLQALTAGIPMADYFAIPRPTSIVVIGCGQPDLIPQYKKFTQCPFPIFADPGRTLFKKLGMVVSLNIGKERPEYMADISTAAWVLGQAKTIGESLRDPDGIRKRDVFRGGNPMQIGGEFLFEDGEVVWCHRMKNYRGHAEVKVLRRLLELDE